MSAYPVFISGEFYLFGTNDLYLPDKYVKICQIVSVNSLIVKKKRVVCVFKKILSIRNYILFV